MLTNRTLRYETQVFAADQTVPRYQGNMYLVCESLTVGAQMGPEHGPGARLSRTTWDAVSYEGSGGAFPFCKAKCAIAFAQDAYKGGYRPK